MVVLEWNLPLAQIQMQVRVVLYVWDRIIIVVAQV